MKIFFVVALNRVMSLDSSYPPNTWPQLQESLLLRSVLLVLWLQNRNSPKLLSSGLTHFGRFRNSLMERNAFKCFYMLPLRLFWSFLIMYLLRGQICEQIHTWGYLIYENYKYNLLHSNRNNTIQGLPAESYLIFILAQWQTNLSLWDVI